jgi:predicted nucleic acid-binding protein
VIVVADTSPITALLTVGQERLLSELFDRIIIPDAVLAELKRTHRQIPPWIEIRTVSDLANLEKLLVSLDGGEAEAILLAEEMNADRLLIDERKGRRLARERGIRVVGLLGVVLLAKTRGLIPSARALVDRLQTEAGVFLRPEVKEAALRTINE